MHAAVVVSRCVTMRRLLHAGGRATAPRIQCYGQHRAAGTDARISHLLANGVEAASGQPVRVTGWIRSSRLQKSYSFMALDDGSHPAGMQVMWKSSDPVVAPADLPQLTTGACVTVEGQLVPSPKPAQPVELAATSITVRGAACSEAYPLQKKVRPPISNERDMTFPVYSTGCCCIRLGQCCTP